jgi:hypothetical protein
MRYLWSQAGRVNQGLRALGQAGDGPGRGPAGQQAVSFQGRYLGIRGPEAIMANVGGDG